MSLTIRTEPMEDRQLALKVEVAQERVEQELRKAARKLAGQYRIPGFRKGKAPYHIVTQYVGLPALFDEFIEELGQEVYRTAIEQEKIEPYAMAALDIETLEPLTYSFVVPLEPEIDLGDYRSLRVEEEEPVIDEAEIDEQLEAAREQYSAWADVDRPSQYGDTLTIDIKSVIVPADGEDDGGTDDAPDGEQTVVLDETDWDVTLDPDNPMDPPGLDDALLGLSPGDEKEVTLSWPAESQSIYAGKQALFQIKVHKIQSLEKPEMNDELAQLIGPDFNTVEDLRNSIRAEMIEAKKAEADESYMEKALDALVEQSTMVYPPVVVEDQIDAMVNEFDRQLRQYGIDGVSNYLSQIGQSMEEYRESLREQAEIAARRNLVISELYQLEGLEATDEDVEERIQSMFGDVDEEHAEAAEAYRNMMRSDAGRSILGSQILQQKALERLLAIARGEEVPEPVRKPEAAAEGDTPAEAAQSADADDETAASEASEASSEEPEAADEA
jgi:trigger factor